MLCCRPLKRLSGGCYLPTTKMCSLHPSPSQKENIHMIRSKEDSSLSVILYILLIIIMKIGPVRTESAAGLQGEKPLVDRLM